MMALLLNPRVWLAIAVIAIVAWACIHIDNLEDTIVEKDGQIALLERDKSELTGKVASLMAIIEDLKKGIEAAQQTVIDMQNIEAQSSSVKQRIRKVSSQPTAPVETGTVQCAMAVDGGEYAKIVNDTNAIYRGRVHKSGSPAPADRDPGAAPVLPGSGSTGRTGL